MNKCTIAFLGTDGSGKSTIINAIIPLIERESTLSVLYEHMRPNYFPSLAVALGKKENDETNNQVCSSPHASKPSGFLGSIVRLSYYWLDYTWGYFRKVAFSKNVVWIFDRYYYDYLIDQKRARIKLPIGIIKLYGLFVPSPDLILCLGGNPEIVYARKPETSLDEVRRQTEALQGFCNSRKNAVWIDTTTTTEESIAAAKKAINEMMSKLL